jgi:hypothetical protein
MWCDVGGWKLEMGAWRWDGWRVRFPASEVKFDFFFILLFVFGFLAGICFASVLFSFSHGSYF